MPATDQQVQNWSDTHVRPRCETIRGLQISMAADNAQIGDVYNALNVQSPTWSDNRADGPPHLILPSDVLAINTVSVNLNQILVGGDDTDAALAALVRSVRGQWPVVLRACVRAPQG